MGVEKKYARIKKKVTVASQNDILQEIIATIRDKNS